MSTNSKPQKPQLQPISLLVEHDLYEKFRAIATLEHRSMAAELRRLMERRVSEHNAEKEAA